MPIVKTTLPGFCSLLFTSKSALTKKPDWLYPIELSKNESLPPSPLLLQSLGPDIDA